MLACFCVLADQTYPPPGFAHLLCLLYNADHCSICHSLRGLGCARQGGAYALESGPRPHHHQPISPSPHCKDPTQQRRPRAPRRPTSASTQTSTAACPLPVGKVGWTSPPSPPPPHPSSLHPLYRSRCTNVWWRPLCDSAVRLLDHLLRRLPAAHQPPGGRGAQGSGGLAPPGAC